MDCQFNHGCKGRTNKFESWIVYSILDVKVAQKAWKGRIWLFLLRGKLGRALSPFLDLFC
jgi:hypothetical protein